MRDSHQIPVRLLATTPTGYVPLSPEGARRRLPPGPHAAAAETGLRYGPYLEAVRWLLLGNQGRKILEALGRRLGRSVSLEEIEWIEIRTEKHGASYHVARAEIKVSDNTLPFAVNAAVSVAERPQLERDFRLMQRLGRHDPHGHLPQAYFKGAGRYREAGKPARWLHMFVAEWFSGYHEFHLHRGNREDSLDMLLWDLDSGCRILSQRLSKELYRQASTILTAYYDWNSFKQIYPWHHAAGDFVLREEEGNVDIRLITVRDYSRVVPFKTRKKEGKLLALILFFLHLTIQMRVDRLDGTGEVAWADDYSLEGTVSGFLQGLKFGGATLRKGIPDRSEIINLLRSFTGDQWQHFLEECLETYRPCQDELRLIQENGASHLEKLQKVLEAFG